MPEEYEQLREVLRCIFAFYAERFRRASLTRTLVEKTVYEYRVSAPPGDKLAEMLGYYWYLRGFFSDRLYSCLEYMEDHGEVEKTESDLLQMPKAVLENPITDNEGLRDNIKAFLPRLAEYSPYLSADDVITKHYLLYAPSPFCVAFSRSFLPSLTYFLHADREGLPMVLGSRDLRRLTRTRLEESTLALPPETHFSEFKRIYFMFEKSILRLVEYSSDSQLPASISEETGQLADQVWQLFSLFLREVAFDKSMTYRLPYWKDEREDRAHEVGRRASSHYDAVLSALGEDRLGEKLVDRGQLTAILAKAIEENRLLWLDTDRFGLDWADLRSRPVGEISATLTALSFTRVFVRYLEKDGRERDYVIKVKEPIAAE